MLEKFKNLILFSLFIFIFIVSVYSALSESRVFDEITHVNAGYQFLVNQDFRYDPFNPPLAREIISVPLLFAKNAVNDPVLFWPRFMSIIFLLLLGFIVFRFSTILYGKMA